jgi:hypothetical protein
MDIVIPLGNGCVWGNEEELRYALRSVQKHILNVRNLYLVCNEGKAPSWVKDAIVLYCNDEKGVAWKDRNIKNKIITAIDYPDLSDDFLFMNDDHFMLMDYELPNFPYYYREVDMITTINANVKNLAWMTSIKNTRDYLLYIGKSALMFDTHTPIIYNKEKFYNTVEKADWNKPFGFGIKSLYANMNDISGTYMPDAKLFSSETDINYLKKKVQGKPCFSTSSYVVDSHRELITSLYPEKSRWEI